MAKRSRSPVVSFDTLDQTGPLAPADLVGMQITIEYADADGTSTTRAITVRNVHDDGRATKIEAYCHLRRAPRTFVADRICSIVDADGVVELAGTFLRRFGLTVAPPAATPGRPPHPPAGAGTEPVQRGAAWAAAEAGAAPIRRPRPVGARGWLALGVAALALLFLAGGGADAMFGFLSLAGMTLVPVAAVWPRLLRPVSGGRLKAVGTAIAMLIAIVLIGVAVTR